MAAALAAVLGLGAGLSAGWSSLTQVVDLAAVDYAGSETCVDCHADRHASWHRTFHRSMTQLADAQTVQGRFDGQPLNYQGIEMRPKQVDGRFYFEYRQADTGRPLQTVEVHRTVGSHRYQQYLGVLEDDSTFVRLHYLWHNQDQRWVHMNAAFLSPDGLPYDHQLAVWNQNCIFCHNTAPQPRISNYEELKARAARGEPVDSTREARFDSQVEELGIACESCHGPGAEHIERAQALWSGLALRIAPGADRSIVNPARLEPARASEVCGQCHAQRVAPDTEALRRWMREGPSYRPGDHLDVHAIPVTRETESPIAAHPELFSLRFWNEGTPRLSAYEFQGLQQSACVESNELSCMDCHHMHSGDPRGQLREENRGNAPCLRCHLELEEADALQAHTGHAAQGEGSLCYACHMPQIVYGVMTIHRSHRIERPDAARDAAAARPNACLNCHLEKPMQWAAQALSPLSIAETLNRADGVSSARSELAVVLAGDPAQKAIAAFRAGQSDGAQRGLQRAWMVPYLLAAMDDIYPSTRRFAALSLDAILSDWPAPEDTSAMRAELAKFDFTASTQSRRAQHEQIERAWRRLDRSAWPSPPTASGLDADYGLPEALRAELEALGRQADKQISIGE
jgi:hypothetical protein